MVKLMSEVKVVTRRPSKREKEPALKGEEKVSDEKSRNIKVVAVGASTGGPAVLHDILIRLSPNIAAPILVVQHISTGFVHGLVNWLQEKTSLSVRVAQHGEALVPGHVYFAPDGCQMGVDSNERILLDEDRPYYGMCPSASYLFRSVSKTHGKNAVGVLLTGMGKDGAEELLLMKEKGAVTIVQDRESSVVHGMPGEAIRLEAAEHVLAPADIAGMLEKIVGRR